MAYTKNTEHIVQGLANIISQFEDKTKIRDLLTVYLQQVQELELAFCDILAKTSLDDSEGQQLDNMGEIVGESRDGRNDLQYRTAIRVRINLNTAEGTLEEVIGLAIAVAGSPVDVLVTELFPAGFLMIITTPLDPALVDVDKMAAFIASGRPAGVRGLLAFGVLGSFQYDGPAGTGFDEGPYGGVVVA